MDMSAFPTNYILIDRNAIAHNVRALKQRVGAHTELIAVVKANAYGHGAIQVAQTALAAGASRLAVARIAEGVALRQGGIKAPILVMGYHLPTEAPTAIAYGLTVTVNDDHFAQTLAQEAREAGKRVNIHVKIDTGMSRFGLMPDEVLPFLERITCYPYLHLEGLWTHFATADEADKTFAWRQFTRYQEVTTIARQRFDIPMLHVANSAAILDLPETWLDAVRPGIALYGLYPSNEVDKALDLRPALSLISHVGRVRTLPAGTSVSYGRTFIAEKPFKAALLPIGYGDGIHRLLSNRGEVLIHGQRAPIRGRVCMDNIIVDVSHITGVREGDQAVLLGAQDEDRISAEEMAAWAETINYEITTSLLSRTPRIYMGN